MEEHFINTWYHFLEDPNVDVCFKIKPLSGSVFLLRQKSFHILRCRKKKPSIFCLLDESPCLKHLYNYNLYNINSVKLQNLHWVKSVRIRCYSGPHFPAFALNIQSECGKMRSRITSNTNTFHTVLLKRSEAAKIFFKNILLLNYVFTCEYR